jgi:hypothetical protein
MPIAKQIKAILAAAVLCCAFISVNWVQRFPYTFPDLKNYKEGFESGWYLFSVMNLGWIKFILAEGLWTYGFDALWRWTGDMSLSFLIVTAVATFLIVYYIYVKTQSIIASLFILNPAFVNLVVEQIRSGLATGIFLFATLIRFRIVQALMFVCSISIHTSFILFVGFYYAFSIARAMRVTIAINNRVAITIVLMFFLAFTISYFRDFALSAFGDNRAFIQDDQTSGILLGVAWILFIVTFYMFRSVEEEYSFDMYFFLLNVFMFISSTIMGVYGARFVAIGIPSLAAMSRHVSAERRPIFYAHYFLFSVFYFIVWLRA